MTCYEFEDAATDTAGLVQSMVLLSKTPFDKSAALTPKTSFDKSAALTPTLEVKACDMPHVCKVGDSLVVLDVFRAFRESAVVVDVVYAKTKD